MESVKCKAPADTGAREALQRTASIADAQSDNKAFAMLLFHLEIRSSEETAHAFRARPPWRSA